MKGKGLLAPAEWTQLGAGGGGGSGFVAQPKLGGAAQVQAWSTGEMETSATSYGKGDWAGSLGPGKGGKGGGKGDWFGGSPWDWFPPAWKGGGKGWPCGGWDSWWGGGPPWWAWKGSPKGSWQGTKRESTTQSACGSKKAKFKQTPEAAQANIQPDDLRALTASITAALSVAHTEGKPYVEGSTLSKLLHEEQPEVVARSKAALGGKGWLRALVEIMPEVTHVEVEGKGEPCFCMLEMAPADGRVAAIVPEKVMVEGQETDAKSASASKKERIRATQAAAHEKVTPEDLATLTATATAAIGAANSRGKPYVEGSSLSKLLQEEQPEVAARAKGALRGKGWLKALVDIMDEVTKVIVEGKGEPCYCLAGMAPADGRLNALTDAPSAGGLT